MQTLRAYLQLVRIPAVFTAMADIFLGFVLAHFCRGRSITWMDLQTVPFGMLLLSSACLYLAGMVLNDIFDRETDAKYRPERPIPSGRIPLVSAIRLAILLLVSGIGAASVVGANSLVVAGLLIGCIFAYDGLLKPTLLGPVTMGMCRFLNVLLGASITPLTSALLIPVYHVAAGLAVYVAGLTWFARSESTTTSSRKLVSAMCVVNLGLIILAGFVPSWGQLPSEMGLLLLAVIVFTINRRLLIAVRDPVPAKIQAGVKTLILSLGMLDATMLYVGTGNATCAIAAALLLLPATILARWVYVT